VPFEFDKWACGKSALAFGVAAAAWLSACGKPQDLSVEQLSAVVDRERATLKPCYDTALKDNPYRQEMRMQAVIHVAPSGKVSGVEIAPGSGLPGMPKCIEQTIAGWKFPIAKDETHASLPLVFKPELVPSGVPDLPRLDEILGLQGDGRKPR
jgi:hypothetical protein